MFKTNNGSKLFTQQRAILKPMKNITLYEEEDEENENDDLSIDDSSSCYSNSTPISNDAGNETMILAQFLATTGPKENEINDDPKKRQQFKGATRLLNKLRKKPTMATLRFGQTPLSSPTSSTGERKNYIPLTVPEIYQEDSNQKSPTTPLNEKNPIVRQNGVDKTINNDDNISKNFDFVNALSPPNKSKKQNQQVSSSRDSGVYSETNSEKESYSTPESSTSESAPPMPQLSSFLSNIQFPHPPQQNRSQINNTNVNRRRPPPLPNTSESNNQKPSTGNPPLFINTSENYNKIKSIPAAALKRKSVRLRHVQVQTTDLPKGDQKSKPLSAKEYREPRMSNRQACPNCRQAIVKDKRLKRRSCPPALASGPSLLSAKDSEDSKVLLGMIMKLKSQLEEEKQCRIRLEKAMQQQQKLSDEKNEQILKEKDKWIDDCLWLDDRLGFLPE